MEVFTAAPHQDVLLLVFRIAVLLMTARLLGDLAQRFGQPSVVGEILAGIVLGPSLLSGFIPVVHQWIIPQTQLQGYLLETVSFLGVMFLLLITGLETDLALIRHHAKTGIGVSIGGFILPFASGFLLGLWIPDYLLPNPNQRLIFALFIATAMSITAIPVIAKVLMDMNLMRRDIGQTIIAAGMCDDTIGWIMLGTVAGLARGDTINAATILTQAGIVFLFMAVSFTLGRALIKRSLDFVQDELVSANRLLTLVVIYAFLWGALSQALKLEAVLGSFVVGILFGQMPRLPSQVYRTLERFTIGILAPIFFAVAGLKVNVGSLMQQPRLLFIAGVVILIACFGKIVGGYLGAKWIGRRDNWTALSFGAAINARGAMEIIIATIGLSLGILSQDMFSIIVLMAIVTSVIAPTLLRWTLKHVPLDPQELKRLRGEELVQGSPISRIHRVLVPIRQRENDVSHIQEMKAMILQKLGRSSNLSVTLFSTTSSEQKIQSLEFLDRLAPLFPQNELIKKVIESRNSTQTILEEARKNYDLIVLGASERKRHPENLFSTLIDSLVRIAPCPTMVVQSTGEFTNLNCRKILVPSNGSLAAKRAAELSFLLADPTDEVMVLTVVESEMTEGLFDIQGDISNRQYLIAQKSIEDLKELGDLKGVLTSTNVQVSPDPESVILDIARKEGFDLIILGTGIRPSSDRLYLGPRVERILSNAPCPVIVLNTA